MRIKPRRPVVTCPKCGYEWTPRVVHPKSCPECKTRLGRVRGAVKVALVLASCLLIPQLAHAEAIVVAKASFDWRGLQLTFNGLTPIAIEEASDPIPPRTVTSTATAQATSGAGLTIAETWDFLLESFWLKATGLGSMSLDLPYTLDLSVSGLEGFDEVSGVTDVRGMFNRAGERLLSDRIFWNTAENVTLHREGVLHLEEFFDATHAGFEPLTGVFADVHTQVQATVPEVATGSLLAMALGLLLWKQYVSYS